MKKLIIVLIALSLIAFSQAQVVTDIAEIEDELTLRPWLDHSVHELHGYKITKVFGERPSKQRHSNMGSITSVAYLDKSQLGEDTLDADGGAVQLFITRGVESRANFKWFFIVIRGEDDKDKIMEIDLEYQAPQLPQANGWWNYTVVKLPESVALPFYIYVNDRQSNYLSDFKFMVNK